ncbi:MAG: DUF1080 domain-containing protein [Planctomycetes bacterium]|nr:DUF1080 domain-containing protein [Planctomycetota bacterium]
MKHRARNLAFGLAALATLPCGCRTAAEVAPWHELFDGRSLNGFTATEFGGEGEVRVEDRAIHLGFGSPLTGITFQGPLPPDDYELEVTARRVAGNDFFCGLTFPVGHGHLTLVLGGWGGAVCGLSSLDGDDASSNPTRTLRHFVTGRDYTALLRVTADEVAVSIDGEPFLVADLRGRRLGLRPEMELSRPLGLASFATAAAVRSLRWRPLGPR